jgi:4-hydroxy-tetrahydrodipicolinate synthase
MKIQGAYAALITPLTESGELNLEALGQLLDHVIAGGVAGVSTLGSTGECATLSPQMRLEVVKETARLCAGRVMVAAGIADSSPEATIEQINSCDELGVDAVLVTPPFYYICNQDEVRRFYEGVARRTELPFVLYNIPHLSKVWVEPDTVAHLVKDPQVIGVKDSSRSFDYTQGLVQLRDSGPDFSIVTGSDTQLVAALTVGADGAWAASLNVAPGLSVGIIEAHRQGDTERARSLQAQLLQLVSLGRWGTFPAGWKAILDLIGIPAGPPAWPTLPLDADRVAELGEQLGRIGILEPA